MRYHKRRGRTPPRLALLTCAALLALVLAPGAAGASPYPLAEIMDKQTAEQLAGQQVTTTSQLLERGAKPKLRRDLAKKAGVALAKLGRWVKVCDLLRIKGVGPEMVRLLEAAKVTTVRQLRTQQAARLLPRLLQANKKAKVTDNPPSQQQVQAWIDQAKKLPLVLQ